MPGFMGASQLVWSKMLYHNNLDERDECSLVTGEELYSGGSNLVHVGSRRVAVRRCRLGRGGAHMQPMCVAIRHRNSRLRGARPWTNLRVASGALGKKPHG